MAYAVKQRTGEIGLRVALGARPKHVFGLIMGDGMKLALLGVVVGLAVAWSTTRLLVSLLFEVNTTDPATFVSISLLLASIALLACFFPARRALSVDPMIALRAE
jgi:putative ABC transport system permease protein